MKIQKKKSFFWVGGGGGGGGGGWVGGGGGGQGGCEGRIEVFGKIHKKNSRGGGQVWGVGLVRGGGGGSGMDVNAMLGVGGDVGYEGCEPRIEGIVQCTKRYCTILRN